MKKINNLNKNFIRILFLNLVIFFTLTGCRSTALNEEKSDASDVFIDYDKIAESIEPIDDDSPKGSYYTEEEEKEEIKEIVKTSLTISATGDCAIGRVQVHGYEGSFENYYDNYGPDYFMENVRSVFLEDDLTIVNLECVLSNETKRVEKTFNIKGKPEYTAILTGSGIEAVSLGNNHSADYGEQSLIDTKDALNAAGVLYSINDETAVFETDDGIKVGMVSVSLLSGAESRLQYLYDGIESLRAECDIVVALCHWGIEREYFPTEYQIEMAHEIIDRGADLVIGNHPHVLQGIEEYKGKIICYSLGNFCFGANKNPSDKDTVIFKQTFNFTDGVLDEGINASIIPCLLSSASGYNNYQPAIAEGDKKDAIINNMKRYSEGLSGVSFDENGSLIIN